MKQSNLLRDKAKRLPESAGCYLMKNHNGTVIYVGKAVNLKHRVSSYFQNQDNQPLKTQKLVENIADFDIILVQTEVESLLLERSLIKIHAPQYNILLRDDKDYPYIRIGVNESWARVEKVRKRLDDNALYLGPFTHSALVHTLLQLIYKTFPIVRCSEYEFQHAKRPCNYHAMGHCLAPCVLPVSLDTYSAMIQDIIQLLNGKTSEVAQQIKQRMLQSAQSEQFELAARYRDQLIALEKLKEKQHVIFNTLIEADAIAVVQNTHYLAFHVLIVRDRHMIGRDSYVLTNTDNAEYQELIGTFLLQYYENRFIPQNILLEHPLNDAHLIKSALLTKSEQKAFSFISAKRGEKKRLLELARKNAEWALQEQLLNTTQNNADLIEICHEINLTLDLSILECIDISNFGGTAIVASCVRFTQGKPDKKHYRLYNIADEEINSDDYAAIKQVLTRRLQRAINEQDVPTTLLIDGGKGQLMSAYSVLQNYNIPIQLVSIAKSRPESSPADNPRYSDERLFLPNQTKPIHLKEGSKAYRLFTQIRDEAHRFAITHHRKRRSQLRHSSVLDNIPSINSALKKRLLLEFQSLDNINSASIETLMQIEGMTQSRAEDLKQYLAELWLKE